MARRSGKSKSQPSKRPSASVASSAIEKVINDLQLEYERYRKYAKSFSIGFCMAILSTLSLPVIVAVGVVLIPALSKPVGNPLPVTTFPSLQLIPVVMVMTACLFAAKQLRNAMNRHNDKAAIYDNARSRVVAKYAGFCQISSPNTTQRAQFFQMVDDILCDAFSAFHSDDRDVSRGAEDKGGHSIPRPFHLKYFLHVFGKK
jgi:hypothetical protein